MKFYESDVKISKYLHIIRDSPVYPVVLDAKRRVMSLPPIINGDHSKISLETKNVFIECTARAAPVSTRPSSQDIASACPRPPVQARSCLQRPLRRP